MTREESLTENYRRNHQALLAVFCDEKNGKKIFQFSIQFLKYMRNRIFNFLRFTPAGFLEEISFSFLCIYM